MKNRFDDLYINIGCGSHPIDGWKNYDYNKFIFLAKIKPLYIFFKHLRFIPSGYKRFMELVISNNISYCNAAKQIPEKDNSVSVLYSSHMLEHLDDKETDVFLKESIRVLIKGGLIRIVVPDFEILIKNYLKSNDPKQFINESCLVSEKPHKILKKIQYLIQGHGWHFNMYNKQTLTCLMKEYGFSDIKILDPGETQINSKHGLDLYAHSNNSIYLEAIK